MRGSAVRGLGVIIELAQGGCIQAPMILLTRTHTPRPRTALPRAALISK